MLISREKYLKIDCFVKIPLQWLIMGVAGSLFPVDLLIWYPKVDERPGGLKTCLVRRRSPRSVVSGLVVRGCEALGQSRTGTRQASAGILGLLVILTEIMINKNFKTQSYWQSTIKD